MMDLGVALPQATVLALQVSRPQVLVPAALAATFAIAILEAVISTERTRFAIQVVNLLLWLVFTSFVLASLFLPLAVIARAVTR